MVTKGKLEKFNKNGAIMKKLIYKVVVSDKGFEDFEAKVSEMLNQGWKPIGGIAFNHSYPHQAMAKVIDTTDKKPTSENKNTIEQKPKSLTANEAMRRLDDLT